MISVCLACDEQLPQVFSVLAKLTPLRFYLGSRHIGAVPGFLSAHENDAFLGAALRCLASRSGLSGGARRHESRVWVSCLMRGSLPFRNPRSMNLTCPSWRHGANGCGKADHGERLEKCLACYILHGASLRWLRDESCIVNYREEAKRKNEGRWALVSFPDYWIRITLMAFSIALSAYRAWPELLDRAPWVT